MPQETDVSIFYFQYAVDNFKDWYKIITKYHILTRGFYFANNMSKFTFEW